MGIAPRGGAPKKPLREREGTQGPWRRQPTCCCRLLRQLLLRYRVDGRTRRPVRHLRLSHRQADRVPKALDENVTKLHILHSVTELSVLTQGQAFWGYKNEVYFLPKALNVYVTKLHTPHSVQSSPSSLGSFLEVSRLEAFSSLQEQSLPLVKGAR